MKPSQGHPYENNIFDQGQQCVWVINFETNSQTLYRPYMKNATKKIAHDFSFFRLLCYYVIIALWHIHIIYEVYSPFPCSAHLGKHWKCTSDRLHNKTQVYVCKCKRDNMIEVGQFEFRIYLFRFHSRDGCRHVAISSLFRCQRISEKREIDNLKFFGINLTLFNGKNDVSKNHKFTMRMSNWSWLVFFSV